MSTHMSLVDDDDACLHGMCICAAWPLAVCGGTVGGVPPPECLVSLAARLNNCCGVPVVLCGAWSREGLFPLTSRYRVGETEKEEKREEKRMYASPESRAMSSLVG